MNLLQKLRDACDGEWGIVVMASGAFLTIAGAVMAGISSFSHQGNVVICGLVIMVIGIISMGIAAVFD